MANADRSSIGDYMPEKEIEKEIKSLEKEMRQAAKDLDFEKAAEIRDAIIEMKAQL